MKLEVSWKTAIKLGFFFSIGTIVYKAIDRAGSDALDSVMMSLAEKGCEPAVRYCKKYQLEASENEQVHNPRKVVGFECYSEES